MAAAGHIPEEDVPAFIPKNVITRSLGPHPTVSVDMEGPFDAAAEDVFLICSDGLSGQIADEELGTLLRVLSPDEAVQTLVDVANLRGGPDNISIVIARVVGESPPQGDGSPETPAKRSRQGRSWTPGLWIVGMLWLLALGVCLVNGYVGGAILAAAGLATTLTWAVLNHKSRSSDYAGARPIGGPYGNGPYREAVCEPNREVVDALAQITKSLRELPADNGLSLDWQPLEADAALAAEAVEKGDFTAAVRHYCHAIRQLMGQIRSHRRTIDTPTDPDVL
jgi:protein phosphatase